MEQTLYIRDTKVTVTDILALIARGDTYAQIVRTYPDLGMSDIMAAAAFAHDLISQYVRSDMTIGIRGEIRLIAKGTRLVNLTELRKQYPRAYETWTTSEEARLVELHRNHRKLKEIAVSLGRQPGAVHSRLQALGLLAGDTDTD